MVTSYPSKTDKKKVVIASPFLLPLLDDHGDEIQVEEWRRTIVTRPLMRRMPSQKPMCFWGMLRKTPEMVPQTVWEGDL